MLEVLDYRDYYFFMRSFGEVSGLRIFSGVKCYGMFTENIF